MKYGAVLAGFIIGIMILSIGAGVVSATHTNFSPQKIWSYKPKIDTRWDTTMEVQKNTIESSLHYDVNGDGVPDVLVEIHNYTAKTYTIVLLSGANGTVLYKNKFTDVASTFNGDKIGIEASIYSITHVDSSGNVISAHQYMIFTNASDTHRISIYKLNSNLSNESYTHIEIPSSIQTPYGSVSVSMYSAEIDIMNFNYTAGEGLLFMGFYIGSFWSYFAMEEQIIMLDYNMNVVWEKKEQALSQSASFYPVGVETTDLNGWGFNDGKSSYQGADVIMVNESSGNTVISAIEASNGKYLWNVTIPGFVVLGAPIGDLGPYMNFIDYNGDHNVDIEAITYDVNSNTTYIYFINSSGKIVGRYNAGVGFRHIQNSMMAYINSTTITRTQDLNGDGYGDCVFVNNYNTLVAFDIKNNKTLYQKELSKNYKYVPSLSRNDVNGDGICDVYLYGLNVTTGFYWDRVNLTALDGKSGAALWNLTYDRVVSLALGAFYPVNISDLNGDGFGNDVIIQGYWIDSQGVYANATIISLKNGSATLHIKIHTNITNSDFVNWTSLCVMIGDVNGDGTNDIMFTMYYHTMNKSIPMDDSFIRFYDGMQGTLLWRGEVYEDHTFTMVTKMMWKPNGRFFATNNDNTVLITTGDSVNAYQINTTAVPEFSQEYFIPIIAIVAAIIYLRRR